MHTHTHSSQFCIYACSCIYINLCIAMVNLLIYVFKSSNYGLLKEDCASIICFVVSFVGYLFSWLVG
jgi:hypothetical protein